MITLSSDFGQPYPAAMKGVILSHTDARLVDVTHEFPRQDVRTSAFWLREVLPHFPPAVHLVVVDPGVGTERDALVVRAGEHSLVGPDNGVLLPVARRLAAPGRPEAFAADYDAESHTFHGRDVFAPLAARVHEADTLGDLDDLAPADPVDLSFPEPDIAASGATGEVLVVDGFGNVVTNVGGEVLEERYGSTVAVDGPDGETEATVARAYAHVEAGTPLVTVGSHGNVELAVNRGRGDRAFGVEPGDRVRLPW
jgi:hypothetical protein